MNKQQTNLTHTSPSQKKYFPTREELHRTFGGCITNYDLQSGNRIYLAQSAKNVMRDQSFDETCRQNILHRTILKSSLNDTT